MVRIHYNETSVRANAFRKILNNSCRDDAVARACNVHLLQAAQIRNQIAGIKGSDKR